MTSLRVYKVYSGIKAWNESHLNSKPARGGRRLSAFVFVMLRLWQMHDELEQYRSIEAIVSLMARHMLRNHQRRKPSETLDETMIISLNSSPLEDLEMKEDDVWLTTRLQQLPTTQRTLLYMRQVERRSHEEIAQLLGIETTSVSTLLARARRTLLEDIKRRNNL